MFACFRFVLTPINFLVFAVKLPELLAFVNIEEETLTRLQQKVLDFLKYQLNPSILCAIFGGVLLFYLPLIQYVKIRQVNPHLLNYFIKF